MSYVLGSDGRGRCSKRTGRGSRGGLLLLSSLGCCCLLLSFVDRSAAFVMTAPGAFVGRCGGGASTTSSLGAVARRTAVVSAEQRRTTRRKTQLGMEVIANNPITSKVYGRPDGKGNKSKTPDMNEEIAASGVSFASCCVGSVRGQWC